MKKTEGLILCLFLLCNAAGARNSGNAAILDNSVEPVNMSAPSCADCGDHYMRTSKAVEIHTESGHRKGTYSVWLSGGKKYIKFNNEWICIEGKTRFFHNGNAYVIKYSSK